MRWACFLVWVNSITWSVKVLVNRAAGRREGAAGLSLSTCSALGGGEPTLASRDRELPCDPWAFTCHDGFPIPFPVRPNADELLPQEGGHVRVAVYKYPHGVLQGDRSQVFHLPGTRPRRSVRAQAAPPARPGRLHSPAHSPARPAEPPGPTSSVMVAEKSMVWRCWEHMRMISFICSSKYSSSILGAEAEATAVVSSTQPSTQAGGCTRPPLSSFLGLFCPCTKNDHSAPFPRLLC